MDGVAKQGIKGAYEAASNLATSLPIWAGIVIADPSLPLLPPLLLLLLLATIVQIFEICSQRGEQRADKSMTREARIVERRDDGWLGERRRESGKVNRAQSSDNSQTSENLEIPHRHTRVYPRWEGRGRGGEGMWSELTRGAPLIPVARSRSFVRFGSCKVSPDDSVIPNEANPPRGFLASRKLDRHPGIRLLLPFYRHFSRLCPKFRGKRVTVERLFLPWSRTGNGNGS